MDLSVLEEGVLTLRLPRWLSSKESTCQRRTHRSSSFDPRSARAPWRGARQPTPVFLPGESHGWRGLAGCSEESSVTEPTLHTCVVTAVWAVN